MKISRWLGVGVRFFGRTMAALGRGTIALVGICGVVAALANYTMTQGTGTTFGSIVVSTVHYAQMLLCDPTTPSQCAGVNPSGQMAIQAPPSLPLPTGAATAALQPTNATQGSSTSSQTGNLVQCAATTAAPSYTTAQTDPFSCDLSGNLRVTASGLAIGSTTSGQQGSMVMAAATTYAPTTTTADTWPLSQDTVGNLRVFQSAPSAYASGTSNTTGTSSTQLIAAVTSERIYASAYDCSNSGSTTTVVSFQDGSGGSTLATTILPAGGGHFSPGNWLIRTTAGNGLFYASGSASTTVYCTATGYAGN